MYVNNIKHYLALFPSDMLRDKEVRLFKKVLKQKGKNGKDDSYYVGKQVIGINTISRMGSDIAKYLNLNNPFGLHGPYLSPYKCNSDVQ